MLGNAFSSLAVGCGPADESNEVASSDVIDDSDTTAFPTTNFGSYSSGGIGSKYINGSKALFYSLIRWDISKIPKGKVTSATVVLKLKSGINVQPTAHRVFRDWSESSVTWNNHLVGYSYSVPFKGNTSSAYPWLGVYPTIRIDITSLMQQWLDGTVAYHGVAIDTSQGDMYGEIELGGSATPALEGVVEVCGGKPDGTTCDDRNLCTTGDSCQSGKCVGTPVVCGGIQCQTNACNPATGTCGMVANGTTCDDGNACTQTSTCQSGVCVGANPIVCRPSDPCHLAGVCQAATGTCSTGAAITPDVATSLKHQWTFDETSGPALDSVGAATGNLPSNMTRTTSFDGSNAMTGFTGGSSPASSRITFPVALGDSKWSPGAWEWHVNAPVVSSGCNYHTLGAGTSRFFHESVGYSDANTYWSYPWSDTPSSGIKYETLTGPLGMLDGNWHHHLFVFDGNLVTAYIDGTVARQKYSPNVKTLDNNIEINGFPNHQVKFDDLRYYGRALTACDAFTLADPNLTTPPGALPVLCPPAPVSSWNADGSLNDSSGTNHGGSGAQNGATPVTFAAGHVGNALALNGSSYVQVPNAANLQITGPNTLSAWVYLNSAGGRIFDKITSGQTNGYFLDTYQGKLRLLVGPNSAIVSP